jgi:1,2-diacylglycerol 3-alpha-glucosyltransferase
VVVVSADELGPGQVKLPGFYLPVKAMREQHFQMARPDRALLERTFRQVDIVHLQFPFWLSFAALAEARRANKPVVASFHVQPENALLNIGIRVPMINRLAYRLWVDRFYDRVDAVICPSPFAESKLRAHGLRARTVVVSNGVPPGLDLWVPTEERPSDALFLVLMVGRLAAEKRPEVLIEAIRRSRHRHRIRVVIAGAGPRHAALTRLAKRLPNGAEVGFVPRERLEQLFHEADLFVHCSEVELEGIAVLEALSVGLPVLVADSPESAASRLALDDAFRFPAGDANALAAKLDALIDAPEVLRAARPRSRELARRFDLRAGVSKLVEVYRALVSPESVEVTSPVQPITP